MPILTSAEGMPNPDDWAVIELNIHHNQTDSRVQQVGLISHYEVGFMDTLDELVPEPAMLALAQTAAITGIGLSIVQRRLFVPYEGSNHNWPAEVLVGAIVAESSADPQQLAVGRAVLGGLLGAMRGRRAAFPQERITHGRKYVAPPEDEAYKATLDRTALLPAGQEPLVLDTLSLLVPRDFIAQTQAALTIRAQSRR
ncbi:MAG TPA: hypothetical protein VLG92_04840 [Candidatus Saccharimonadia bacterium]|nr:hypothetical protein [Candidatus Saccharimonadia bacterium]